MNDEGETGGARWFEVLNAVEKDDVGGDLVVPLNVVLFRARARLTSSPYSVPTRFDPSHPDGLASARLVQSINDSRCMYVSPAKNAVRLAVSNWMTGLRRDVGGKDDFTIVTETLKRVMLMTPGHGQEFALDLRHTTQFDAPYTKPMMYIQ
jgi:hypothetical protein